MLIYMYKMCVNRCITLVVAQYAYVQLLCMCVCVCMTCECECGFVLSKATQYYKTDYEQVVHTNCPQLEHVLNVSLCVCLVFECECV